MASILFYQTVLTLTPYMYFYGLPKARRMYAPNSECDEQQKYHWTKHIVNCIRRAGRVKTKVYGAENIPENETFVLYSNHQDKYDAPGIILSCKRPIGMLWGKKSASMPLCKEVVGLTDSVLVPNDSKGKAYAIHEAIDKVSKGKNLLVFPEGKYTDNHNNLQPFNYGCFTISLKTKTTIVPVVLYDAYKAFGVFRWGRAHTEVHYLPPIKPEEYEGMTKAQLGQMVEERISRKLEAIKRSKNEI